MWTTRRAIPDDAAAVARLFAWLGVPDPAPDAAWFAQQMLPRVLVACAGDGDGEVVGYAYWRVYATTAHVVNVVVDPRVQGRGLGRVVMEALREAVRGEGCDRWYLNVKRDNAAARRLYERCGLAFERDVWAVKLAWAQVAALPPGEPGAAALGDLPRDADAAIAARFGLDRGRLANLRARPGLHILGAAGTAADPGALAYAAFDPQLPGAVLFCAARVALARPLLDACRAYADLARAAHPLLVLDNDRPLHDALRAAGAEPIFELLQLGAPVDRRELGPGVPARGPERRPG